MPTIPESQHTTAQAIVRWYESKPQEHRPHMGASLIGHECERHVWMSWRWALKPSFPGRILRLFSSGVREESRLLEELRGIGATVWETDPETGNQWRVSALRGHFGGSLDGVAVGLPEAPKTPAVLEFKTHNHKSFTQLVEKKVRAAKPQHFDQMTVYMGLMELERALYMAVDKDTDDLYTEWVHFDQERFDFLMERAERLINATTPPPRISDDPTNWQCKFCNFHPVCHGQLAAEMNCRTCCHSTPDVGGLWHCEQHNVTLRDEAQRAGCSEHLLIPALVSYAEPIDGGVGYVTYKHKASGVEFSNGPGPEPRFTSAELHHCPDSVMKVMQELKAAFPGARVVSGGLTQLMEMPNDLDNAPTKADRPEVKEKKARISKTVAALKEFKAP